jgi:deazaflavin-dependent oxidoreductase (nitroreductase family)
MPGESGQIAARGEATRPTMMRRRPSGFLRLALKTPTLLYRVGAGRLLGRRFLLLTHRGRTSARIYRTPIEVMRWDAARREATVLSAWGRRADWIRNIAAAPPVEVRIAAERWPSPAHRILSEDDTAALLDEYRRTHRIAGRILPRVLGWPQDATGPDLAALARTVTAVAFRPHASNEEHPPR